MNFDGFHPLHFVKNNWQNAVPLGCMVQVGPPSLHYCCAVVLLSSIVLPPVGHSSNHEYHCCQLTGQSRGVSNFYHTFKVFIWLTVVEKRVTRVNERRNAYESLLRIYYWTISLEKPIRKSEDIIKACIGEISFEGSCDRIEWLVRVCKRSYVRTDLMKEKYLTDSSITMPK